MNEEDQLVMARQLAAQAWCAETTRHKEMDADLAEQFALILSRWIETARSYASGQEFYHGLLTQCGELLGPETKVSDDGSIQDTPLALKIPEVLAAKLGLLRL